MLWGDDKHLGRSYAKLHLEAKWRKTEQEGLTRRQANAAAEEGIYVWLAAGPSKIISTDFDCETPQKRTSLANFLLLARRGESIVDHVSCWGG